MFIEYLGGSLTMNKNVKKLVAATVVAGLAVAPVAAQTNSPVAQAAEQA